MTERSFLAELSLKSIGFPVACVEITVAGCVCVCVLSLSTNRNIISAPMSHCSSLPTTSSFSPLYRRRRGSDKFSLSSLQTLRESELRLFDFH